MVVFMSTPRPHSLADLSLAPVLIEVERNLAWLRASENLEFELALQLNDDDSRYKGPAERADRIVRCVTRNIDLHGWKAEPTQDRYGVSLRHGDYQVSLMFGELLTGYVVEHRWKSEASP
jgi:hypothetical protein